MMWTHRVLTAMAAPLGRINRQVPVVERLLGIDIPSSEIGAVLESCSRSNCRIGSFYYWYLQKLLLARRFRTLRSSSILPQLNDIDLSPYGDVAHAAKYDHGLIVAIPHFGHYIPSIIGLIECLRARRKVLVFYGSPRTHAGNDLFDRLHTCLYGDGRSNVTVIHDNRLGMAHAIRSLSQGAALVIMPDVFKHERDTYQLPFCGRAMNVMLGTATLARKTGAAILPAVSMPSRSSLTFRTIFGQLIYPCEAPVSMAGNLGRTQATHIDYRTTASLFEHLESVMADKIVYWQYARSHYKCAGSFPALNYDTLLEVSNAFFEDPRINFVSSKAICID